MSREVLQPGPCRTQALGFPLNWTDFPDPFPGFGPLCSASRVLVQSVWFEDSQASASVLMTEWYSLAGTSRQVTWEASFPPTMETVSGARPIFGPGTVPALRTEFPYLLPGQVALISAALLPPTIFHSWKPPVYCLLSYSWSSLGLSQFK